MFDKGSFNEGCNVEKSAANIKHPSHPLIWIIMKLWSRWFSELFRRRKLETENRKTKNQVITTAFLENTFESLWKFKVKPNCLSRDLCQFWIWLVETVVRGFLDQSHSEVKQNDAIPDFFGQSI